MKLLSSLLGRMFAHTQSMSRNIPLDTRGSIPQVLDGLHGFSGPLTQSCAWSPICVNYHTSGEGAWGELSLRELVLGMEFARVKGRVEILMKYFRYPGCQSYRRRKEKEYRYTPQSQLLCPVRFPGL